MDIVIKQRKFSLRSEYDISTPAAAYRAQKKFFFLWRQDIQVWAQERDVIARVKSRFYWIRARYDFELFDGAVYRFHCTKLWKGVFACEGKDERYWLYQHKGLKYSIFLEDRQVAAFTKNSFKIGKGDRYDIRLNHDANIIVIICMALTIDASEYENDDEGSIVDIGNVGPEEKAFDQSWVPR